MVIGTWPYTHHTLVLAALAANKHVLTEARLVSIVHSIVPTNVAAIDAVHVAYTGLLRPQWLRVLSHPNPQDYIGLIPSMVA